MGGDLAAEGRSAVLSLRRWARSLRPASASRASSVSVGSSVVRPSVYSSGIAATTASIKFRFQTPYKGGTKIWSTTFHVSGGNWQDQAHFNTFSDNLKAQIYSMITTRTTLLDTTGYNPGSDVPVFTKAYNVACTQSRGTSWLMPLEAAILLRFTTTQRSTKNHPIYLFNYIHDIYSNAATTPEVPDASLISFWTSRCAGMIAGYSDGSLTRVRVGPRGAVAQTGAAEAYAVHRDFPR